MPHHSKPISSRNWRKLERTSTRLILKHGLCRHGVEGRAYASQAEADSDETPAEICEKCGKEKLVVALNYQEVGLPDELPEGVKLGRV